MATKTAPGAARRESCTTAVTSGSAAPGGSGRPAAARRARRRTLADDDGDDDHDRDDGQHHRAAAEDLEPASGFGLGERLGQAVVELGHAAATVGAEEVEGAGDRCGTPPRDAGSGVPSLSDGMLATTALPAPQ